jgi:hypothetical protein
MLLLCRQCKLNDLRIKANPDFSSGDLAKRAGKAQKSFIQVTKSSELKPGFLFYENHQLVPHTQHILSVIQSEETIFARTYLPLDTEYRSGRRIMEW